MTDVAKRERLQENQPLDSIDEFLKLQNLPYQRTQPDLVEIDATGSWTDYHVSLRAGHPSLAQLGRDARIEIACAFATRMPEARKHVLSELVHLINQRLPIGHFELTNNQAPTFRYAVLSDMLGQNAGLSLANLVEQSISLCEHYFPVFQMVSWSELAPNEALAMVNFEHVGQA